MSQSLNVARASLDEDVAVPTGSDIFSARDQKRLSDALSWVERYTVGDQGIAVSSKQKDTPYPEVSGYFIPTLLNHGHKDLALQYGRWLVEIQQPDGAWRDFNQEHPYTFDTGQILKGLFSLSHHHPEFMESLEKGAAWVCDQIQSSGEITTPNDEHFGNIVPSAIHLYCLEPVKKLANETKNKDWLKKIKRAEKYYLGDENLTGFSTLSHFHAYVIEALVDLGHTDRAAEGMREVAAVQRSNGVVPGWKNKSWVCSTGLFQYAVIWYKLGDVARADRAFAAACRLQNKSGGWNGSYGLFANYFKRVEISWAVKYFLDAWTLREKAHEAPLKK